MSPLCLPGLACDGRLFDAQRAAFPRLRVLEHIPAAPGETLPAYAVRVAAAVPQTRPLHLLGVSFGAIVAQEAARVLRPDSLTLIAGAVDHRSLPWYVRAVGRLGRFFPDALHQLGVETGAWSAGLVEAPRTPQIRRLLRTLAHDADPVLSRWAGQAILSWHPATPPYDGPTLRIHGTADLVLRCPPPGYTASIVARIQGGGHLINLTHPDEVNRLVLAFMQAHE